MIQPTSVPPPALGSTSTSVDRYAPPLLPPVVSWYSTPSPPLSKFAARTIPGIGNAVPVYGVERVVVVDCAAGFATIVRSLVTCPGALVRYVDGLRTI